MSTKLTLNNLTAFVSLIHKLQQVKRVAMTPPNKEQWENTTEHSYQLVMLAWYVVSTHKLNLDLTRVMHYALVHDLAEVYAGDTYFEDTEGRKTKETRERKAREQIKHEFPEFPELYEYMESYEKREDEESVFVYALDKLIDPMNNALNDWEPALQKGITLDRMNANKRPKVALHPLVAEYYEELADFIAQQNFRGA